VSEQPSSLRLRFETVGSIAAIVVGVIALFVSWDQARVMRQDIRASVWPALQVQGFVDTEGGGLALGLNIENAGVGPALIERITVRHRGEVVEDLDDLEARVTQGFDLSFETVTGRILAAGDSVQPFVFRFESVEAFMPDGEPISTRQAAGLITSAWTAEVCYCSSLGQCWTADTTTNPPAEAAHCDLEPASAL
jgi:hypothetical protein